jgi:hypothetical protein
VCKPKEYGGLGILNLNFFCLGSTIKVAMEWMGQWVQALGGTWEPLYTSWPRIVCGGHHGDHGKWWKGSLLYFILAKWTTPPPPRHHAANFQNCQAKIVHHQENFLEWFLGQQFEHPRWLSVEHIKKFYKLWEMTHMANLDNSILDSIRWKFGKDGEYSASTAYKMQFLGHTTSIMPSMVWKPWEPPKCKTFA